MTVFRLSRHVGRRSRACHGKATPGISESRTCSPAVRISAARKRKTIPRRSTVTGKRFTQRITVKILGYKSFRPRRSGCHKQIFSVDTVPFVSFNIYPVWENTNESAKKHLHGRRLLSGLSFPLSGTASTGQKEKRQKSCRNGCSGNPFRPASDQMRRAAEIRSTEAPKSLLKACW